ncbi:hypothetical protein ACP70R_005411 [Stipagrostis hirtigluma subsp. patula]
MASLVDRELCPDRILGDLGNAFVLGAVGGSAFHFIKGLRSSPNGTRVAGGLEAMRMNAPRVAGSFAVWCGLFSACDCALVSGAILLALISGTGLMAQRTPQPNNISVSVNDPVIAPVETSSAGGIKYK